jgi:hypothetical protein
MLWWKRSTLCALGVDMSRKRIGGRGQAQPIQRNEKQMRRFVIGALVGAGLMYFYLYDYARWQGWASGRFNTVGAEYRGDAHKRQADAALR